MDRNAKLRQAEARRIALRKTANYEINIAFLMLLELMLSFGFLILIYTFLPIPTVTTINGLYYLIGFSISSVFLSFTIIWPIISKVYYKRYNEINRIINELLSNWDEEDKASN